VAAVLLLAAHGTRSAAGSATTAAFAAAVQAARPDMPVELCFLDVARPSLADALPAPSVAAVVVPFLLSAGYHVTTDIPAVVAGRDGVRVARHLGPDPAVVAAVADRLGPVADPATVLLATVPSSRQTARDEIARAADLLAARLGRPVRVLTLGGSTPLPDGPLAIASYLLAEGDFLDALRTRVGARGVVADPIGTHPAVVDLVWARYDEVS
jgi:sirohydrochlorin ferrochelatase